MPQPPQLALLFGTQLELQQYWLASQASPQLPQFASSFGVQVPPQQSSPAPQARPHMPQLLGSAFRSMQLPAQHVVPVALQSSVHPTQVVESGAAHVPPQQLSPAAQEMLHPPHCAVLVRVSTQVPLQH